MSDDFSVYLSAEPLRLKAPPKDLGDVATIAANHMQGAIVKGELKNLVLLTFHGAEMSTWILTGTPPAPLDEIVKSLASQAKAEALAFVYAAPVPPEITADRTTIVAVEGKEGAVDILYAMRGEFGEPGATFQIAQRPLRTTRKWLGVPTTWSLDLYWRSGGLAGGPAGEA